MYRLIINYGTGEEEQGEYKTRKQCIQIALEYLENYGFKYYSVIKIK